jgi:hypothetical protein
MRKWETPEEEMAPQNDETLRSESDANPEFRGNERLGESPEGEQVVEGWLNNLAI